VPRYLITIGRSQEYHARTTREIIVPLPRTAQTKAHRALMDARTKTVRGKDYDYWTVCVFDQATNGWRQIAAHKLP